MKNSSLTSAVMRSLLPLPHQMMKSLLAVRLTSRTWNWMFVNVIRLQGPVEKTFKCRVAFVLHAICRVELFGQLWMFHLEFLSTISRAETNSVLISHISNKHFKNGRVLKLQAWASLGGLRKILQVLGFCGLGSENNMKSISLHKPQIMG